MLILALQLSAVLWAFKKNFFLVVFFGVLYIIKNKNKGG